MNDMRIGPFAVIGFLLELGALVALGYFGFTQFEPPLSIVVGLGLPLAAAVLWGLFRAPRRAIKTPFWGRIAVEVLVMGGAVVALVLANQPVLAAVFGIVALVSGVVNDRAEYRAEQKAEAAA
jgi:predicted Kef-type K+ transport protein